MPHARRILIVLATVGALAASAFALVESRRRLIEAQRIADDFQRVRDAVPDLRSLKMLRLAAIVGNTLRNEDGESVVAWAAKIRNHLYRSVPLRLTPAGFDFFDFDTAYNATLQSGDVGHYCGGITCLYLACLEAHGIPARYVGLFDACREPYESHASVEIWIDGRWIASDPTFNVMFRLDGAWLSYAELLAALAAEKPVEIVSNGFPIQPGRDISSYFVPLRNWKYVVMHPAVVYSSGRKLEYPLTRIPADWDGVIEYRTGPQSVDNFTELYQFLSNGPLR